jgi:hypothetical protein
VSKEKPSDFGIRYKWSYKFPNVNVCKYFFLRTLNITKSTTIENWFNQKDNETPKKVHWKLHTNNKSFNKSIENYIMNLDPKHSHCNFSRCPNRRYISDLYRMSTVKLYRGFAEFIGFEALINDNENSINKKNENENICNFLYFNNYHKKMNMVLASYRKISARNAKNNNSICSKTECNCEKCIEF